MQKELMEKKNDLITRAEDVLNTAKTEKRELTDAEAQELAEIRDNVRRIVATLKLDDDFREMEKMEVKDDNTPTEEEVEMTEEEKVRAIAVEEEQAFENYLRGKEIHERAGELSPATTGAGAGGALIPTTILDRVIRKVYDICPVLERSQKFNVKGKLEVPFYPADSNKINVAYQSEFSPLASSSGSFDTVELGGFLAGALTKVSRSLINNVEFDIVGFVVDEIVGISRFSWLHILKPEATISSTDEGIITGLVKDEDRIVCILDFEKIVSDINPQCGLTSSDLDASVMKNSNKREDYSLLVAEDSKLLNKLIVKSLLDAGYQVKSVWNGSEAWDEITACGTREELLKKYQLLITDIEMPVMDGITLARNVKKSDEYKSLPICVFSSLVNEMLINKVKELEIDAMITKPEIGKLVEKIDSMLGISISGK